METLSDQGIIWQSTVTAEAVAGLTPEQIRALIRDLDDEIMRVCQWHGLDDNL